MEKKVQNISAGRKPKELRPRPAIRAMEVGDVLTFPIEKLPTVKTTCSDLGFILNRRYTTSTDRDSRTIEVTRIT